MWFNIIVTTVSFDFEIKRMEEFKKIAIPIDEEVFAQKYARLVMLIARRYYLEGGEYEDLVQEGMIGLLSAIRSFDSNKSSDFEAFAALCIKRKIYDAIRKNAPKSGMEITALQSEQEAKQLDLHNPETQFLANESAKEMELALSTVLSRFESSVAKLYLSGLNSGEIAKALSRPKKSVDNAIIRIRKKAEQLLLNGRLQE